jgi:hypothetical protein
LTKDKKEEKFTHLGKDSVASLVRRVKQNKEEKQLC